MHYCLSKQQMAEFLDYIVNNNHMTDDSLSAVVEGARIWQDQLICFSYLFSMILEKKAKGGIDCHSDIEKLYELPEELCLSIQEFDSEFVRYMLGNLRNDSLSLEEDLVQLQTSLSEHFYDKTIRY